MERRCLFVLVATVLYLNNIQCDDAKHHTIDFLKPTNDENLKHEVITTTPKTNGEDGINKTTPKTNGEEPSGIQKFLNDVKNKFNHVHPVRDVKNILFGSSDKKTTNTVVTTSTPSTTTETTKTEKSHIAQITESMPSESEDMIRVITLKEDEHYGKGKAKPKYLTMELEKMNSTEYVEGSTPKTPVGAKSFVEDLSTSTSSQKTTQKRGSDSIRK